MSGIEFEDSQTQVNQTSYQTQSNKGLTKWLIDKKIAKDEKTANIILFSTAIIFFATSIILFKFNNSPKLTPEQIDASRKYMENLIGNAKRK